MDYVRDLPDKKRMQIALQWLRDNPQETPTVAARMHFHEDIKRHAVSVRVAWAREKKKKAPGYQKSPNGGQNKVLTPAQTQALI
jgi:hypothetical protein